MLVVIKTKKCLSVLVLKGNDEKVVGLILWKGLSGTRSGGSSNAETQRELSKSVVILIIIKVKTRNSNYAKVQIRIMQNTVIGTWNTDWT